MLRDDNIPFYYRIWLTLRSRIQDGVYHPDEILPSTKKLAEEFGVSDITIKRALASLVEEGFLERKRGIGTRIKKKATSKVEMPLATTNFWDWYDDREHSVGRKFEVLAINEIAYPAWLDGKMVKQAEAKLFCLKRVLNVKEGPVSYFVNYFWDTLLDSGLFHKFKNERFLKVIIDDGKMKIAKVKQEVRVTIADIDLAKILSVGFGDPLFHVENIYYAKNGNDLALTHMYHRGDVYSYTGTTDFNEDVVRKTGGEIMFTGYSIKKNME